jgi:hypothetical protein
MSRAPILLCVAEVYHQGQSESTGERGNIPAQVTYMGPMSARWCLTEGFFLCSRIFPTSLLVCVLIQAGFRAAHLCERVSTSPKTLRPLEHLLALCNGTPPAGGGLRRDVMGIPAAAQLQLWCVADHCVFVVNRQLAAERFLSAESLLERCLLVDVSSDLLSPQVSTLADKYTHTPIDMRTHTYRYTHTHIHLPRSSHTHTHTNAQHHSTIPLFPLAHSCSAYFVGSLAFFLFVCSDTVGRGTENSGHPTVLLCDKCSAFHHLRAQCACGSRSYRRRGGEQRRTRWRWSVASVEWPLAGLPGGVSSTQRVCTRGAGDFECARLLSTARYRDVRVLCVRRRALPVLLLTPRAPVRRGSRRTRAAGR